MRTHKWLAVSAVVVAGVAVVGVCWAAAGSKLYINGNLASTGVVIVDGHAYVSVADLAKALGMTVQQRQDGYELVTPGGANQIEGSDHGRIGDQLFTGKWRFEVISMQRGVAEYQERYYQQLRKIKPATAGEELLVLNCRVKNGTDKTVSPILTERLPGDTALADDTEHSYAPLDYDARQEMDKTQSYGAASLLPGAASEFALVFSAPKGTNPKALVFSLMAYPQDVGKTEHTNVRVDLTQQAEGGQ